MGQPAKTYGRDFNFFRKVTVSGSSFTSSSTLSVPFVPQGIMFINEDGTNVVEFSYNGNTVHGELNPTLPSRSLTFNNIGVCGIWFRMKSGPSAVVSFYAWSAT